METIVIRKSLDFIFQSLNLDIDKFMIVLMLVICIHPKDEQK
jgi:hypothetical protein